jgi:hypothetical protein
MHVRTYVDTRRTRAHMHMLCLSCTRMSSLENTHINTIFRTYAQNKLVMCNVMYVSINKQLISFQTCHGVLSQLC